MQALVGAKIEVPPLHRQGADVIHDLATEFLFARIGDVDLFLDGTHKSLVGLFVLSGVAVLDLLPLREGLDVVDIVGAQLGDGFLVGADGALDFVLHHVLVLLFHQAEQHAVVLALLVVGDE